MNTTPMNSQQAPLAASSGATKRGADDDGGAAAPPRKRAKPMQVVGADGRVPELMRAAPVDPATVQTMHKTTDTTEFLYQLDVPTDLRDILQSFGSTLERAALTITDGRLVAFAMEGSQAAYIHGECSPVTTVRAPKDGKPTSIMIQPEVWKNVLKTPLIRPDATIEFLGDATKAGVQIAADSDTMRAQFRSSLPVLAEQEGDMVNPPEFHESQYKFKLSVDPSDLKRFFQLVSSAPGDAKHTYFRIYLPKNMSERPADGEASSRKSYFEVETTTDVGQSFSIMYSSGIRYERTEIGGKQILHMCDDENPFEDHGDSRADKMPDKSTLDCVIDVGYQTKFLQTLTSNAGKEKIQLHPHATNPLIIHVPVGTGTSWIRAALMPCIDEDVADGDAPPS
jgi:hypothetical protein